MLRLFLLDTPHLLDQFLDFNLPLLLLSLRMIYAGYGPEIPSVSIPSTLLNDASLPWNFALVGKFLGRSLSSDHLLSSLTPKWSHENEWDPIPLNYGFYLFHFNSASYHDLVLNGGPWVVNNATLALELWTPSFIPSPTRLPRTVVWMRMPDLPPFVGTHPFLR